MKFNVSLFFTSIFVGLLPEIFNINDTLDYNSKIVLSMTLIMVCLWFTEAIPSSVTALIPIIVVPFLNVIEIKDVVSRYSSPVVFLILGGFLLAFGFEKSNLHKRIALKAIIVFGNTKRQLLICCIFSTAFFSMWLSNTATCLLMLPIIKFLVDNPLNKDNVVDEIFPKILLLSVAYSSSIGGMITPIGTIPNAIMLGFLNENYNYQIDFIEWVFMVLPLALIILTTLSIYFCFKVEKKSTIKLSSLKNEYKNLGTFSFSEKISSLILVVTASLWIFKNYLNSLFNINLSDASIVIFCSLFFFIIPIDKKFRTILGFDWYRKVPWNILILFGGGLSMAFLVSETGLARTISEQMYFIKDFEIFIIILLLTFFTSIITEFTSNTATTFLLLPLFAAFAIASDINVIKLLLPIVLAASCAFMMPISTPPNAIVFSTNKFTIKFMVTNGIVLNLLSILIISLYVNFFILLEYNF